MILHPDPSASNRSVPLARSVLIVGLFVLSGPLLGGIGVAALATILAAASDVLRGDFGALPRQIVGGMIAGSIFSVILGYAVGSLSALGVGIVVALRDRRTRGVSLRAAVLAALGFWVMSATVVVLAAPQEGRLVWIGALLAAHLIAGLACGWIARKIFGGTG
jgi:hypothetical protein